ncbi:CAP-Gly domain-containing linker protein 3-like [Saccostrea cucullata]|uniref:CAP-Gly domain-containing linker protein 3-like n=1 Tax=Saccostrea cuccullata TaxID=36930 RepID=UPI002ED21C9D
MVLYQNINFGQRVEVKLGNLVFRGVVKYKGSVVNRQGDWVGVALERPVGENDGMILGRRYFQCPLNHGTFVRAGNIRFIPMIRCLYNRYHRVSEKSYVEEPLFSSTVPKSDPAVISGQYQDKARNSFAFDDSLFSAKRFPLRHSVGNHIPAATMKRAKTAMASFRYLSSPIHSEYDIQEDFIATPTIPKTHMPYSALKRQVGRGWEGTHYVREMSVGTGRDSIKFSTWNDISP